MAENPSPAEAFGLELLAFRRQLRQDGFEKCFDDIVKKYPAWEALAKTVNGGWRMLDGIRAAAAESFRLAAKKKSGRARFKLEEFWERLPEGLQTDGGFGTEYEAPEVRPLEQNPQEGREPSETETAEYETENKQAPEDVVEQWNGRISDRTYRIASIANGVFGLHVSHDAILADNVSGEFASISFGGGMGFRQAPCPALLQICRNDGFTLKLEVGMTAAECESAFESANFLVWHEIAHLVNSEIAERSVSEMEIDDKLKDELEENIKEVVIDAIAMRLGMRVYVHPLDRCLMTDGKERRKIMIDSHLAAVGRVLDLNLRKPVGDELLLRLLAELFAHRALFNDSRLEESIQAARKALSHGFSGRAKTIAGVFARLYYKALKLDPLVLPFQSSDD